MLHMQQRRRFSNRSCQNISLRFWFAGVPKAMLGATVVRDKARPEWPANSNYFDPIAAAVAGAVAGAGVGGTAAAAATVQVAMQPPMEYRQLAEACWAHDPQDR